MKVLDLCSGIGGFSLGLERAGMETVAFCEVEEYPRSILKKHWPNVPIFEDIRELDGSQFEVDIVCGGFPCQPFSVAGDQKGKKDDRNLWPQMLRIIQESKPTWVICENVIGFIKLSLDDMLLDLENSGYTSQSFIIPACAVEAHHRRERVWIVAYTEHDGFLAPTISGSEQETVRGTPQGQNETVELERIRTPSNVADTKSQGSQGGAVSGRAEKNRSKSNDECVGRCSEILSRSSRFRPITAPTQSPVCHRNDGVPDRVARLKALGNAVVPQIPEIIGRAIMTAVK